MCGDTWLMDRESRTFIGQDNCDEVLRILNSHDDLVAALKRIKDKVQRCVRNDSLCPLSGDRMLNEINAALAKAEGGK